VSDCGGVGFLVNPIAGMGGRVGLHGTDGVAADAARRLGAPVVAGQRARRALDRLRGNGAAIRMVTVEGAMGGDLVHATNPGVQILVRSHDGPTTAADTREAAAAMCRAGVRLILFAGGDGTARDVVDVVGTAVPVLGVPAGVKMHSGVFAVAPEAAGETAARFLADPEGVGTDLVEVLDVKGGAPVVLAMARVPHAPTSMQRPKAVGACSDAADLAALGREVAEQMLPGRLYLLGPGTTVAQVNAALGVPASLAGVDAVVDGRVVAADLAEDRLLELLNRYGGGNLVLGVIGGQGFLLGRGNQQLSLAVLDAIGADNVEILAARSKVAGLDPPVLRVDVGDDAAQSPLAGYQRVRTGKGRSIVLRVLA